ncbi:MULTISPECIES: hypothetical protein [unclassified Ensifer]|uniref:hypothetical protein n=1 Tax=unclassified Ensifer TaxID=2633371 RepID=UPI0008132D47|nr:MULTISPECIES: hypothetical protein [unclassified Ensifer]OCO98914.1 hypothetical protein BC362_27110 [Ensifer sp. LC14]OCP04448.1 hypothetical protein BBX50_25740 [Ensifer sp. LC11]OCP04728.1 hypothetical protein BC374_25755 [Ensifer sp. LC13]OCP30552.1 hypothetical protein BC364_25770 [Ensifer sp. LC499]
MTNDSANLPFGGSKTVDPATGLDDANLDFWEPEDEANPGPGEGIDDGAQDIRGEGHDDPNHPGDEPSDPDEDAAANDDEDFLVVLKGGEEVPFSELKLGYMRDRDYRHKTQDIANRGRVLEGMANRVAQSANAFANLIASQIPPEPPEHMAALDPDGYRRQWALHQAGLERIDEILSIAEAPATVVDALSEAASDEQLAEENAKLVEAFPETADAEGRLSFFAGAFDVAEALGFSQDEVREVTDHRLFKLAHYARLGLAAEQAKRRAMSKLSQAPATVARPRPAGKAEQSLGRSREAMKRLSKSGSIRDAMGVDFD